jgi:outer membrane protein
MAYVFKNYDKFKAQTAGLQADIKAADDQARAQIENMKVTQERLASLANGSTDKQKAEASLIEMQTKLETFRKTSQLEFLRREADVYKTVYLEVQEAVAMYAKSYDYTLIMRFNRGAIDEAEDPQSIIQSMNRQVVFFEKRDDCTDPVLQYLNSQYKSSGAAGTAGTAAPSTARPKTANGGNPATRTN